jgi:tRNA modification GTPase
LVYDRLRVKAADSGLVGHKRQAEALARAAAALQVNAELPPEFLAEALRQAAQSLAVMVGRIGAEDYLDEIFASFCIGK